MEKTRKKEIKKERRKNLAASDASCSTVDFLLIRVIYLMRKKREKERKKEEQLKHKKQNERVTVIYNTIQYTVRYTQHTIQTAHTTPLAKLKIKE